MEVSGRLLSFSGNQSIRADRDCAECSESGLVANAAGFCQTCRDYLCEECIIHHKKIRGTRDHTIRDSPSKDDFCVTHQDEPLTMYCLDHNALGCNSCFSEHKFCKIARISELSKTFSSSPELTNIKETADRHKQLVDRCNQTIQEYQAMNNNYQLKVVEDYRNYKQEIDTILGKIGDEIYKKADRCKQVNDTKIGNLAETVKSYNREVESFMIQIKHLQKQKQEDRLFILGKKCAEQIKERVKQLEALCETVNIQKFSLITDPSIKLSLSRPTGIRVETDIPPATKCTAVSQMNVKSPEDNVTCLISGIIQISPTQLVITDKENSCLKLIDINKFIITKRRELQTAPSDITMLSASRLAVALPQSQKIVVYTVDLDPRASIDLDGECVGIHYTGTQLLVSYERPVPHIQVLDLTSSILKTIGKDASGLDLFADPGYLTYSLEKICLYVSCGKLTVTCISLDGEVKWTYKDKTLKDPHGVVVGDRGCLYICSRETHSIHVVSASGKKLGVISKDRSGLKYPRAVCYISQDRALYVSSDSPEHCNFLKRLSMQ